MTDGEDWSMVTIAIIGLVSLLLFVDWMQGPRYHSETGLGETLQGRQEGLWK